MTGRYTSTRLLDRRRFLSTAGLLAAGSAFGHPLLGCVADFETNIPCLGVVPAPVPVAGMSYIRASQIGCALDCDLRNGRNKYTGGAATDDGPRINAAMAGATESSPITLIIDGSALISGLFLPAGGHWSIAGLGCGTGFFVKMGTNNDGIHNGSPDAAAPSDPGPPVPVRGANVRLSNFAINGNRGNGRNGNSTTGSAKGDSEKNQWYFAINLMNLNDISIENVVVVNSSTYNIRFSNVGNVTVSGCVIKSTGPNTDGLHFNGPANDVAISSCDFTTGDDAIALNCPEGHRGNISRVAVDKCTFNSTAMMRLHTIPGSWSSEKFTIDTVTVSNCKGTLSETAFWLGSGAGSMPNSVTGLTITDCSFVTPTVFELSANFGNIALNNVTLVPLDTVQPPGFAFARTSKSFKGMTYEGSRLFFNHCVIARNRGFDVAALILENDSAISSLEFNGFAVEDAPGESHSSARELLHIVSGSVGQLVIDALDSAHIKAPVSTGGFSSIGSVNGAGVLATGWEFPDAVMANGTPYISANSHLPSVKVDGAVELLP